MDPIRVMLVDDNPTFLRIVTSFLKKHYCDELDVVATAGGGEEALAKAGVLQPQVVLLDLAMPGLSGIDTLPRLHQVAPHTSIIALTAYDGDSYREAALTAGADDFVSKKTLSTDLLPAIRRVAHAKQVERW